DGVTRARFHTITTIEPDSFRALRAGACDDSGLSCRRMDRGAARRIVGGCGARRLAAARGWVCCRGGRAAIIPPGPADAGLSVLLCSGCSSLQLESAPASL